MSTSYTPKKVHQSAFLISRYRGSQHKLSYSIIMSSVKIRISFRNLLKLNLSNQKLVLSKMLRSSSEHLHRYFKLKFMNELFQSTPSEVNMGILIARQCYLVVNDKNIPA